MQFDSELPRELVIALYTRLLDAWNARSAEAFAGLFSENGNAVGFDGSQMDGRDEIASSLGAIFGHHPTASYVARVREVRSLGPGTTLLRAAAGMIPPGGSELKPERNAIQSLVAVLEQGQLRIALFQNTPARFDGRPELTERLTAELTGVHRSGRVIHAD
jgi:uncharacterized protein (TIGR02246 family)